MLLGVSSVAQSHPQDPPFFHLVSYRPPHVDSAHISAGQWPQVCRDQLRPAGDFPLTWGPGPLHVAV